MKRICFVLLIISFIPSLVKSKNLEWNKVNININGDLYDIMSVDSTHLLIQTSEGIFIYKDFKMQERIDNDLILKNQIASMAVNSKGEIIVGIYESGIFKYSNGKWNNINYNNNLLNIRKISVNESDDIAVISIDYDRNITYVRELKSDSQNWTYFEVNDIYYPSNLFYNSSELLLISDECGIYKKDTDNVGKHYLSVIDTNELKGNHASSKYFNKKIYFLTFNHEFKSFDLVQNTWQDIGKNLEKVPEFEKIFITKKGEIIITSYTEGIYYSNDGGTNFEQGDDGILVNRIQDAELLKDNRMLVYSANKEFYLSNIPKNQPLDSNKWSDRIFFKELEVSNNPIDYVKCSIDGKSIFTIIDSSLQEFDIDNGSLLSEKIPNEKVMSISISEDNKTYSTFTNSYIGDKSNFKMTVNVYDYKTDLLLKEFSFIENVYDNCQNPYYFHSVIASANYILNEDILYINFVYQSSCDGSAQTGKTKGRLTLVKFLQDTVISQVIYNKPVFEYLFTPDKSIVILTKSSSYFYNHGNNAKNEENSIVIGSADFSNFEVILSDKNENEKNTNYRDILKLFYSPKRNKLIAWSRYLHLYQWNFTDNLKLDSIKLDSMRNSLFIDKNQSYLVMANHFGFDFINYLNIQYLSSIILYLGSNANLLYDDLVDLSGFVSSGNGKLRLFKYDKINNVELYKSIQNKVTIYPNPATDFITINLGSIGTCSNDNGASPIASIEIFDVMGVLIHYTPVETNTSTTLSNRFSSLQRIDISHLPTGVYFVKIGDKVEKFIKFVK